MQSTAKERAAEKRQVKLQELLEHLEKCSVCALAAWYASSRREPNVDWPKCEEGERLILLALHASRYPSGVDVVLAGECELQRTNPMDCLDCRFGHASECHYPLDCATARCHLSGASELVTEN